MENDLIYIRNTLLDGRSNDDITDKLQSILRHYENYDNLFTGVCQQAINNALKYISENKFEDAAYQINLIHNFPWTQQDFEKWDENHFYEFELPVYFEHTDDVNAIKKMIICLAELTISLSNSKLPNI